MVQAFWSGCGQILMFVKMRSLCMSNVENYPGPSSEPDMQQPEEHPYSGDPSQVEPIASDERAVHKKGRRGGREQAQSGKRRGVKNQPRSMLRISVENGSKKVMNRAPLARKICSAAGPAS